MNPSERASSANVWQRAAPIEAANFTIRVFASRWAMSKSKWVRSLTNDDCRHATCARIIAAAPRADAAAQTMSTARSVRIWKCEFQREHASNDAELSYVTLGISLTCGMWGMRA